MVERIPFPETDAAKRTRGEGFAKADRLRHRNEFLAVQRRGTRVYTRHFVVLVLRRKGTGQRLGVTVTKRVAKAVGRNRVKRLAREVFRRNRRLFPPDSDVVMVARRGADALDYIGLRSELAEVHAVLANVGKHNAGKPGSPRSAARRDRQGERSPKIGKSSNSPGAEGQLGRRPGRRSSAV